MNYPASIIITVHDRVEHLTDALVSAAKQTVECEIVLVEDCATAAVEGKVSNLLASSHGERVALVRSWEPFGVSAARNAGIKNATSEYLMFLDDDDTIELTKIERQIAELEAHPEAGWCFCDTRIIDAVSGKDEPASKRYDYAGMNLNGDLSSQLAERNFIPVHAPLIWRPALGDIRFREGPLEDWAFWRELAAVSSCRYVPEVLATYRAGRNGRNRKRAA